MTHHMNVSNKPEARLDNWNFYGRSLCGTVSGHPRQQEFESSMQVTSPVVRASELDDWAETSNTFYILGDMAD